MSLIKQVIVEQANWCQRNLDEAEPKCDDYPFPNIEEGCLCAIEGDAEVQEAWRAINDVLLKLNTYLQDSRFCSRLPKSNSVVECEEGEDEDCAHFIQYELGNIIETYEDHKHCVSLMFN